MSTASQYPQGVGSEAGADSSGVGRLERATEFCIEDHPTSAALVTFLSGLGAGFFLTMMILGEKKQPQRNVAERVGYQVLDYIQHAVPRSVSKRF